MGSKTAVYAILAVALGYILISTVPDQIVVVEEGSQPVRAVPEKAEGLATESDTFTDEKMHLPSSSSFTLWDGAYTIGLWIINLLLALGVYFLVKRRIS
jgi:hypothetical protein